MPSVSATVSATDLTFSILQPRVVIYPHSVLGNCGYQPLFFQYGNPNNSCYTMEKSMISHWNTELWNQHGASLIYYVTDYNTDYDRVFGEDRDRSIIRSFKVQGYTELPLEVEHVTIFGIDGQDNFKVFVAQGHFAVASTVDDTGLSINYYPAIEPNIGDIIQFRSNQRFYEIVEVKDVEGTQLQSRTTWTLFLRVYKDLRLNVQRFQPPIPSTLARNVEISAVNNQDDLFKINDSITSASTTFSYNASANLEQIPPNDPHAPNDPFGGW